MRECAWKLHANVHERRDFMYRLPHNAADARYWSHVTAYKSDSNSSARTCLLTFLCLTTDGGSRCLATTRAPTVLFALPPRERRVITMHVTFLPPPDLHSRPGEREVRDRRNGWLPTTGERIVTPRIVHVAAACSDRSRWPVGTTARMTRARARGHDRPEFLRRRCVATFRARTNYPIYHTPGLQG